MLIYLFLSSVIVVALYGYFSSIKITPLEKDIRAQGIDYECYECKKKFSVDLERCPDCQLITIYGQRKKKYWRIIPILLIAGGMFAKFFKFGMFN